MENLKISQGQTPENLFFRSGRRFMNSLQYTTREEAEAAYQKRMCPDACIKEYLEMSGIPKRFKGKKIDDVQLRDTEAVDAVKSIQSYLKTFPDRLSAGASGFLCGNCGTGKTLLACIIVEAVCCKGYAAHYTTAWKMLQQIRKGYNREGSVNEYINEYVRKPLIVIDEIGIQHGSQDERVLLYQVLDGRYNDIRPTILISNSKDPVKDGFLDMRIIDRLKDGGGFSITFSGESFRK